jgi:exosortase
VPPFRDLRSFAAPAAAAALLLAVYWPTLDWLLGRWGSDPFYSHGPLIPLVSGFLLWRGRDRLRPDPGIRKPALGLLAAAALLLLLGARLKFELLASISLLASLAGLLHLAGGATLLREATFPLAYLLFALPLPVILLEKISLPLQMFSAAGASAFLSGLGVDVARRGVFLVFPGFTLAVADACSGLRSLITVGALAALAAHFLRASRVRKAALAGAGLAAALLANILRIALSGLVGLISDGSTAVAFFEGASGYLFFSLVILGLLGASMLLESKTPESTPETLEFRPGGARPPALPVATLLLPLLVFLAPAGAAAAGLRASTGLEAPRKLDAWNPVVPGWEMRAGERRDGPPGEELWTGRWKGPDGREIAFSALHAVSGRYLHSPEACSLAAGWIAERQELVEAEGGLPVNCWILRRGSERVGLLFWFTLAGVPQRSTMRQHLGALWQRLRTGRVDSAYGELSLPLAPGEEAPWTELIPLGASLQRALQARLWP